MINSGAIMSAALLLYLVRPEMSVSEKYEYVYDFFNRMAGREHVGQWRLESRVEHSHLSLVEILEIVCSDWLNFNMLVPRHKMGSF